MRGAQRLLIVGTGDEPAACETLLHKRFDTRSRDIDALEANDVHWSELILVTRPAYRRSIAERYPDEYLARRVIGLDLPDWTEPGASALIHDELVSHGLLPRTYQ